MRFRQRLSAQYPRQMGTLEDRMDMFRRGVVRKTTNATSSRTREAHLQSARSHPACNSSFYLVTGPGAPPGFFSGALSPGFLLFGGLAGGFFASAFASSLLSLAGFLLPS